MCTFYLDLNKTTKTVICIVLPYKNISYNNAVTIQYVIIPGKGRFYEKRNLGTGAIDSKYNIHLHIDGKMLQGEGSKL